MTIRVSLVNSSRGTVRCDFCGMASPTLITVGHHLTPGEKDGECVTACAECAFAALRAADPVEMVKMIDRVRKDLDALETRVFLTEDRDG